MCIIRASIKKKTIKEHILSSLELVAVKKTASLLTARARRNGSFDYRVLGTLSG